MAKSTRLMSMINRPRTATLISDLTFSTAAGQRKVELFYDVISPYAWIGMELMLRANKSWNVDLRLRPVYFVGMTTLTKNKTQVHTPAKFRHGGSDVTNLGSYYNIPIRPPSDPAHTLIHKGTICAQRFLTALDVGSPEHLAGVSRQLWLRIWSRDQDITATDSIVAAARAAGCNDSVIENAVEKMNDGEIKTRLRVTTQEAVDNGSFGVPTFLVYGKAERKQMFWGSDRFQLIARELGYKDPAPLFV